MKADDFGRFHADPRLLKSYLFPLLSDTRETDCSRWLAACEKAGLLRCYVDDRGRNYLEIVNFRQRTRQSESKFPTPDKQEKANSPPANGQGTVKGRSKDGQARTETETKFGDGDEDALARARDGGDEPLSDVLAEIFPGIASERKAMEKLVLLAMQFKATPDQIRGFPDWLSRNHPRKALNHWAFRDHFHQSLNGDIRKSNGNAHVGAYIPPPSIPEQAEFVDEAILHLSESGESQVLTRKLIAALDGKVGDQALTTWFRPLRILDLEGGVLRILAPSRIFEDWISNNYREAFGEALDCAGFEFETVEFVFRNGGEK